jgi:hypothetical protein
MFWTICLLTRFITNFLADKNCDPISFDKIMLLDEMLSDNIMLTENISYQLKTIL